MADGLFTRMDAKLGEPTNTVDSSRLPLPVLHKLECKACPLNHVRGLRHPKMEPTGSDRPEVYVLGEAPGANEDRHGQQFIGASGQILRARLRGPSIRFNNVVRTRPPKNATPSDVAIECCRPSVERDIEKSKPRAIAGFGNIPLKWATGQTGIKNWRGRRFPIRIGDHTCWFYPMMHPAFVLRAKNEKGVDKLGAEWEICFARDINRLLDDLEDLPEPEVADPKHAFDGVVCLRQFDDIIRELKRLRKKKSVGLDLETTDLRPYATNSQILTVAIGTFTRTVAFPIHHREANFSDRQKRQIEAELAATLKAVHRKIVQNGSFELEWLGHRLGQDVLWSGVWEDTRVQAYVLDERPGAQNLDALCIMEFGLNLKSLSDVNRSRLASSPLDKVLKYNGGDAKWTYRLFYSLKKKLQAEKLQQVYNEHRQRIPAIAVAQLAGLDVDQKRVTQFDDELLKKEMAAQIKIEDSKAARAFQRKFRRRYKLGSPQDTISLFRDVLHCREVTNSASEKILQGVKHPVAKSILELRRLSKLRTTYIVPVMAQFVGSSTSVLHPDLRLHTQFNHTLTSTGRLSSEAPNNQNWPSRKNKEIRSIVVPPPGHVFVCADYGQIEARTIGMDSQDQALVDALWTEYDIHMDWSERLVRADDRVLERHGGNMKAVRSMVKNLWVFPAFYGAGHYSISRNLMIDEGLAEDLLAEFWDEFRGVKQWQDRQCRQYSKYYWVESLSKRRRHGPMTRNMVINHSAQGTASDIVVSAMHRLARLAHRLDKPWLAPVLNVHDDLTFAIPKKKLSSALEHIVVEMLDVPWKWAHRVPLTIEVSSGPNWYEQKEVGKFRSDEILGVKRAA